MHRIFYVIDNWFILTSFFPNLPTTIKIGYFARAKGRGAERVRPQKNAEGGMDRC
jgi:hypothetical protein